MAKWIVAEKAKAGLRHAVVCPNVTGRTKERISPKQADSCRFARSLLISHKWREIASSWRLVCRCHDVFLWCYICFVLLCFASFFIFMLSLKPRPFVQSSFDMQAPLRPHLFFGDGAFSEYCVCHPYCFLLSIGWIVRHMFSPSGWCFSTL